MEEAEAADLRPLPGMSPATPDIARKPARRIEADADGSSLSTAAPAPALMGAGKVESDDFASAPPLAEEQCQAEPGMAAEEDCAPSTQESTVSPPPESECCEKIAQQEGAASAIPTPEKVEATPRRPRKRSTKGVPRFKVMKDTLFTKRKATPKTATPIKVRTKRKVRETGDQPVDKAVKRKAKDNGDQPVGKPVNRKLDFVDDPGNFRSQLKDNLKCLAKVHSLKDDLGTGKGNRRGKKRKLMGRKRQEVGELAIVPYQKAPAADASSSSALVPSGNSTELVIVHRRNRLKKLRTRVLGLDESTLQVYDALRKWDLIDSESFDGTNIGSGLEWDKIRQDFEDCVDEFIAAVHGLLGPRNFSEWGGSVIDSVVGTFLTQNVADNLSSNAFMNLAAKFPPIKRRINNEVNLNLSPLIDDMRQKLNLNEQYNGTDNTDSGNSVFTKSVDFEKETGYNQEVKGNYGQDYKTIMENFISVMNQEDISTWDDDHLMNMVKDKFGTPICPIQTLRNLIATQRLEDTSHWDKLREEAYNKGYNNTRGTGISDSVDWEALLHAPAVEVANCIVVRGQHYVMASRIQAFLMRVKKDHGSFDLEWLRYVPRQSAKDYLLSILGLGDKSVDCIRLLSLKHKAFPVDVNVARIVTRLGWINLEPVPDEKFHLVDLYPIMSDVQRYLWPRLCTIQKEKLYELHCLMITFGKVLCTKVNPNCSACPLSAKCKYYNSSFARAGEQSIFSTKVYGHGHGENQASMVTPGSILSNGSHIARESIHDCNPIIEAPRSPEHEFEESDNEQEEAYEDDLCDLEDAVPEVQYADVIDLSSKHMVNNGSWTPSTGKDLVLANPRHAFVQNKKMKNTGRLRTEYNAYVLPDDHEILEEFEERVQEDPSPYLLIVTSFPDDCTVKGTILIPCRTATRGNFPLNGTYFQDHEVFADHSSSRSPITIPREYVWMLDRRTVYLGASIHSITKGQTRQEIQECFMKGYICVRGFDRKTRYPKRLCASLHATNEKKETGQNSRKRTKTSKEGTVHDKAPPAK
ncbi:hypothetical protein GUJ93_ZPchr0006g44930 [Zizania palustris]|uniref:Demeter RRM-fold domain-containing protein n=1 Tax=Zizania palustris TaxID=103762 RepID=A0A8J5VHE7_ZIZPA|nr:hypothetical protein GUJ93_ZPchr0006g44930 [Zizania palustris]